MIVGSAWCSTVQPPPQVIPPPNKRGLLRQVRLALGLSGPGHTIITPTTTTGAVEAIMRQDMRFALARWVATTCHDIFTGNIDIKACHLVFRVFHHGVWVVCIKEPSQCLRRTTVEWATVLCVSGIQINPQVVRSIDSRFIVHGLCISGQTDR